MGDALNILVSEDHDIPIYLQISHQITYLIYSHQLRESDQLPAVRVLAEQLKVNPNTVSQAYYELQNQGMITSQRGRGTFVSASSVPETSNWSTRHDLLLAELARMRQRVHALGFVDADISSQLFGATQSSQQACDIAVITPGRSAAKYATAMGAALVEYGLALHPVPTEKLIGHDSSALETLERCYFVITLVSVKQQVEDLLMTLPSEHCVIVTSLDITPATIGQIAEIPARQAICVFAPERYQPIAVNILHSYSLVEHRSITRVLEGAPRSQALSAFDAADLILHTFSSGPLLDAYGVPTERRLELGFEISAESLERLRDRFAYRIRMNATPVSL